MAEPGGRPFMADINFVYSLRAAIDATSFHVIFPPKSEQVRISFINQKTSDLARLATRSNNQNNERLLPKDSIRERVSTF